MGERAAADITAPGSGGFDMASGFPGDLSSTNEKVGDLHKVLPLVSATLGLFESIVSLMI